jgi:hypothetical protein
VNKNAAMESLSSPNPIHPTSMHAESQISATSDFSVSVPVSYLQSMMLDGRCRENRST